MAVVLANSELTMIRVVIISNISSCRSTHDNSGYCGDCMMRYWKHWPRNEQQHVNFIVDCRPRRATPHVNTISFRRPLSGFRGRQSTAAVETELAGSRMDVGRKRSSAAPIECVVCLHSSCRYKCWEQRFYCCHRQKYDLFQNIMSKMLSKVQYKTAQNTVRSV